jgi:Glycosyltransferase
MGYGGAERVIVNLCEYFINSGNQVNLITCYKAEKEYVINKNINTICLEDSAQSQKESIGKRFFIRRKKLKKVMQTLKTDVIICFLPEPIMLMTSLKGSIQAPIIISERSDPKTVYSNIIYKLAVRWLYIRADGCVFQTKEAQEYFDRRLQQKSTIIVNPVNESFVGQEWTGERDKTIVSVGRLEQVKNFQLLIQSFYELRDRFPDYKLIIYGDGPLREELSRLIQSLNMDDRIILYGRTNDVINQIRTSSLFVLTSDHEGMPNALVEAMVLGLPVIATDCPCGGVRYLIEDNVNGKLIPIGNQKALEDAMTEMLQDKTKAEKFAQNAVKIIEKVEPSKIYGQWEDYIVKMYTKDNKSREKIRVS